MHVHGGFPRKITFPPSRNKRKPTRGPRVALSLPCVTSDSVATRGKPFRMCGVLPPAYCLVIVLGSEAKPSPAGVGEARDTSLSRPQGKLQKWRRRRRARMYGHQGGEGRPTISDPMDCSLPGSSIHGIFQARVLEWDAIAFSYTAGWRLSLSFSPGGTTVTSTVVLRDHCLWGITVSGGPLGPS